MAGRARRGGCAGDPLHTLDSIFDDPHLNATGFFDYTVHPTEGPLLCGDVVPGLEDAVALVDRVRGARPTPLT